MNTTTDVNVDATQPQGPTYYRARLDAAAGPDRQRAEAERTEFWTDTCREPTHFHIGSPPVQAFYRTYGCLFCEPSHSQVQDVLTALDGALPHWDRDHPELFYETLKVNFPELVRTR